MTNKEAIKYLEMCVSITSHPGTRAELAFTLAIRALESHDELLAALDEMYEGYVTNITEDLPTRMRAILAKHGIHHREPGRRTSTIAKAKGETS